MTEFLNFMDELSGRFPFHMEIYYSKIMDWCITVYKKGCASDYPNSESDNEGNAIICREQDPDMALCFAKAHIAVKNWLLTNEGGY